MCSQRHAESREQARLDALIRELSSVRSDMIEIEAAHAARLEGLSPSRRASAINLLHYLAVRHHDVRPLQEQLAVFGLSSLGRAEAHVAATVDAVLRALCFLANRSELASTLSPGALGFDEGSDLLRSRTGALLGPARKRRRVRIMVTMPSEAGVDYPLVRDLVASGMDCMRINCAYDDAAVWSGMIENLRRAERKAGRGCKVLMDLAGPKLRTGPLQPGPRVLKWRPRRNDRGETIVPALVWLTPMGRDLAPPLETAATVPVAAEWLSRLGVGTKIRFRDARGSKRSLTVVAPAGEGWLAESSKTTYVVPGTLFRSEIGNVEVTELPALPASIVLGVGDRLVLTRSLEPGAPAVTTEDGTLVLPAHIGVTLPEIFACVRSGEAVLLDDGKIAGVAESVGPDAIVVRVTRARSGGTKLLADKGVNLPESDLRVPALTPKDLEDLEFVARHADLVGYSFVQRGSDVVALQERLSELGGDRLGIVLKIETRRAFERLPELLLAALRSPVAGVMIARGDLAVECGYERLAEIQEEMLWICEAAHMPVIWATQVLENLAKEGQPSRAEITDAAMGERAECVMLNKGPFIVEAVRALDDILRRMQDHQTKKSALLRHLRVADEFVNAV